MCKTSCDKDEMMIGPCKDKPNNYCCAQDPTCGRSCSSGGRKGTCKSSCGVGEIRISGCKGIGHKCKNCCYKSDKPRLDCKARGGVCVAGNTSSMICYSPDYVKCANPGFLCCRPDIM